MDLFLGKGNGEAASSPEAVGEISVHGLGVCRFDDVPIDHGSYVF